MTDKEMLELAAKAAGIELRWHPDGAAYADVRAPGYWGVWNPLTDDGDALRLAVKLGMHIVLYKSGDVPNHGVTSVQVNRTMIGINDNPEANWKGDPYAATRRAITRAAAEIAKTMEQKT